MHKAALLTPLLAAACSTAPAGPPVHGESPGRACRSDGLAAFAGRAATSETGAEILRVSNATLLRWVPHGMMVTMEYRADRVTVWLNAANRIDRVTCG
ncbi:MAG TPA: I78 family peptidase inhibitor [Sphingomicrobium sp.]|nr:I78 family peptidase inhibitor [Sphingomicrobium sp.]